MHLDNTDTGGMPLTSPKVKPSETYVCVCTVYTYISLHTYVCTQLSTYVHMYVFCVYNVILICICLHVLT